MSDILTDEQLAAVREHPEPNIVRILLSHIDAQAERIAKLNTLVLLARRERDAYAERLHDKERR